MKSSEKVWVIRTRDLRDVSMPLGSVLASSYESLLSFWHVLHEAFYTERAAVEEDPTFKQVIPYVLVSSGGKMLSYCRAGSEGRLTGKTSIGIGGHINPEDAANTSEPPRETVLNAMRREVQEELYMEDFEGNAAWWVSQIVDGARPRALLYDGSDEVGRVHLGVAMHVDLPWGEAGRLRLSAENKDLSWRTIDELQRASSQLEAWSRCIVDAVVDKELYLR